MILEALMIRRVQLFAVIGSLFLFSIIFELVRKKMLREQYSLIWLFVSLAFIVVSFSEKLIIKISNFLGIFYAPTAFLLMLIIGIFLLLLQFSVVISSLKEKNKILAQKVAILETRLFDLEAKDLRKTQKDLKKDLEIK